MLQLYWDLEIDFRIYLSVSQLKQDKELIWGWNLLILMCCDPPLGQKDCSGVECQWKITRFSLRNNAIPQRLVVCNKGGWWGAVWSIFEVKEGLFDVLSHGGTATRECPCGPWGQQEPAKFAWKRDGFPESCWQRQDAEAAGLLTSNSCTLNCLPKYNNFFLQSKAENRKKK